MLIRSDLVVDIGLDERVDADGHQYLAVLILRQSSEEAQAQVEVLYDFPARDRPPQVAFSSPQYFPWLGLLLGTLIR